MGLVNNIKLTSFTKEQTIRFDVKFLNYYNSIDYIYYTYKDLFDFIEYKKIDISILDSFKYVEIGNVTKLGDINPVSLSFDDRNESNEDYFKKIEKGDIIKPKKGDILLSKIRPYLNKNILIRDEDYYFTKAMIQIRPKINSTLLYYALRTYFFDLINAVSRQGKGYPTLKENDLKSIKFPKKIIDNLKVNEISLLHSIEPIEKEIEDLKSQKKEHLEIINDVFSEELKFDWDKFNNIKKEKIFTSNLLEFSNNLDTRFSYKFHNRENKYLYEFLVSKTIKKIKDFIDEPIVLGKSITPSLYDEDGEHYYIAMSSIKNYRFDTEGCQKVGIEYFTENKNKSIQLNDILIARSGEGTIGKVAIIKDDEVQGIFADFTMRIRLTNYNQLFAYYYFRSDFFQYLVYTHKKGLGNNTNIFPSQIQEFPLLDFDLDYQQILVDKIKNQIDTQKDIDKQIEDKQNEISMIIEDCIIDNSK